MDDEFDAARFARSFERFLERFREVLPDRSTERFDIRIVGRTRRRVVSRRWG